VAASHARGCRFLLLSYKASVRGVEIRPGSAQRFLAIHAATFNAFTHQRHLLHRPHFKELRTGSFRTWSEASATA